MWDSMMLYRRVAAANQLAAVLVFLFASLAAGAQSLAVLPVNIFLPPGQMATTLRVTNQGTSETAIQIRAYAWSQPDDSDDQLAASDAVVVSPPLASIAPGATQVVRLILRQPPQGREATYRILVDQIPPPAEPGIVRVVLRLSIPVFAQPATRAVPHVQFHVELNAGQTYLVGINDGLCHEVIRDIALSTSDGRKLKAESSALPYILAGATRRWRIVAQGPLPLPSDTLLLKAHAAAGAIDEQVRVVASP
jgi:fimbrial chaperone protein